MPKNEMYKQPQVRIEQTCVCGRKAEYTKELYEFKEKLNLCRTCYHNSNQHHHMHSIKTLEDLTKFLIYNKNEVLK